MFSNDSVLNYLSYIHKTFKRKKLFQQISPVSSMSKSLFKLVYEISQDWKKFRTSNIVTNKLVSTIPNKYSL